MACRPGARGRTRAVSVAPSRGAASANPSLLPGASCCSCLPGCRHRSRSRPGRRPSSPAIAIHGRHVPRQLDPTSSFPRRLARLRLCRASQDGPAAEAWRGALSRHPPRLVADRRHPHMPRWLHTKARPGQRAGYAHARRVGRRHRRLRLRLRVCREKTGS